MHMGASSHPEASCAGRFYQSCWESVWFYAKPVSSACTTRTAGCSCCSAEICAVGACHIVQWEIDPRRTRSTAVHSLIHYVKLMKSTNAAYDSLSLRPAREGQIRLMIRLSLFGLTSSGYDSILLMFLPQTTRLCFLSVFANPIQFKTKECSPRVHAWSMLNRSERELAWLCCDDRHLGRRKSETQLKRKNTNCLLTRYSTQMRQASVAWGGLDMQFVHKDASVLRFLLNSFGLRIPVCIMKQEEWAPIL